MKWWSFNKPCFGVGCYVPGDASSTSMCRYVKTSCFHNPLKHNTPLQITLTSFPLLGRKEQQQELEPENKEKLYPLSLVLYSFCSGSVSWSSPSKSEDKFGRRCADDWFVYPGIVKTWMFSHSGPRMALKRPRIGKSVLCASFSRELIRTLSISFVFWSVRFGCKTDRKYVLMW